MPKTICSNCAHWVRRPYDWAPGSSGAAILDACGNCIGHVSTISTLGDEGEPGDASHEPKRPETHLVIHNAVRAADVLSLIKSVQGSSKKPGSRSE